MDADHIGLRTVDRFMPYADFYTIDVADWIGKPAPAADIAAFAARHAELVGKIAIPGIEKPFEITATASSSAWRASISWPCRKRGRSIVTWPG